MSAEPREHRLKRMKMRAWRRGTREMDLLLGTYADGHLAVMDAAQLDRFDDLLAQEDMDLNAWFTGQTSAPAEFAELLGQVLAGAQVPGLQT